MVTTRGAFGRGGLTDWLLQRISAVILALSLVAAVIGLLVSPPLTFATWQAAFQPVWVKVVCILALAALLVHTWIGLWTVVTDYIHGRAQCMVLLLVAAATMACGVWGIAIVWGV